MVFKTDKESSIFEVKSLCDLAKMIDGMVEEDFIMLSVMKMMSRTNQRFVVRHKPDANKINKEIIADILVDISDPIKKESFKQAFDEIIGSNENIRAFNTIVDLF